jgi:Ni/Co efflux regulator RcnB
MKMRIILYALTLAAYALSMAHSVIPHHHHASAEEARNHEHHGDHKHASDHHHHHENNNGEKKNALGHLFFFTHDANVDVIHVVKLADNGVPKSKKAAAQIFADAVSYEFELHSALVFQPPQNEIATQLLTSRSLSLRAPPAQS